MIGEWFSDIGRYFTQRLRNPVLAPFSAAWIVSNWQLVLLLFFGNQSIQRKIAFIEENYLNVSNLVVYPLVFALAYALVLPWVHLAIESYQEKANLRRRLHRLNSNTRYLRASVDEAEAQAALNRILAQTELTRKQEEELEELRSRAEIAEAEAQERIAAAEDEFNSRLSELDDKNEKEHKVEVDKLRYQLEAERQMALEQQEKAQAELRKREEDLQRRLAELRVPYPTPVNVDLEPLLLSRPFRLFHNPGADPKRSKVITFQQHGVIGSGKNKNENSWRITDGKLELVQQDGKVHSRFQFLPDSGIFVHTGDADTRSASGQYIVPDGT